ncbi:MAG: 3-methyl-2-oxobutanoate hydroxymethyltransferase [Candidatus Omnitrophica bacterium]|nr:3-methyl-2-oxobutanoate hydroxymethyltransferase [Candidatus Omnitrophota bacterium]
MKKNKLTVLDIIKKKAQNQKISMLTAYDYPMACLLDDIGIDIVLVGDSLGNVVLGQDSTISVTMEQMLHHTQAVKNGIKKALLVADMPFMSYNVSIEQTIINAGRFLKQAGADAIKLEGANSRILQMVKAVVEAGIPVMGHIGLTPQTAGALGGFKVQGKDANAAKQILENALALEKAGCFSIVFECIPDALAALITQRLSIPTIGIGAGPKCDGQVLVTPDLLGLNQRFTPKFVKKYADLSAIIKKAISEFVQEVNEEKFPDKQHSFTIKPEELNDL